LLTRARVAISSKDVEDLADELASQLVDEDVDDVTALYREMRALLREADTPSNRARYDILLQRLRQLQEVEADEMERYFDQHRPLPEGAGDEAVRQARELLKRYEGVAAANEAVSRANKTNP
jgi:hypothetical protein